MGKSKLIELKGSQVALAMLGAPVLVLAGYLYTGFWLMLNAGILAVVVWEPLAAVGLWQATGVGLLFSVLSPPKLSVEKKKKYKTGPIVASFMLPAFLTLVSVVVAALA